MVSAPPWDLGACWSLFASERAEASERVRAWADKARLFLRAEMWLAGEASDGVTGLDVAVDMKRASEVERVRVYGCAVEQAPSEVVSAAHRAVRAMGGAGFDVLMARAKWFWQVEAGASERAKRAAMVVSAAMAMVELAPAMEPGGGAIMGVKGIRERLG